MNVSSSYVLGALAVSLASLVMAEPKPYRQSFRCMTDGLEPGRWYELTLEIHDARQSPEPTVAHLMAYGESPFGDRFGEVDYSVDARARFPKIYGRTAGGSLELTLGEPISDVWDIRSATMREASDEGAPARVIAGKCLFVGARP